MRMGNNRNIAGGKYCAGGSRVLAEFLLILFYFNCGYLSMVFDKISPHLICFCVASFL